MIIFLIKAMCSQIAKAHIIFSKILADFRKVTYFVVRYSGYVFINKSLTLVFSIKEMFLAGEFIKKSFYTC